MTTFGNPLTPLRTDLGRKRRAKLSDRIVIGAASIAASFLLTIPAAAQFSSGSDGSDGALDLTGTPPGVVDFDLVARGIDPEGDNIFHFTTITIPAGVTLKLSAATMPNLPVQWLASGAVQIDGTLDLSGEDGHSNEFSDPAVRSIPGAGGFAGGVGARGPILPEDGLGPGKGLQSLRFGFCGGHTIRGLGNSGPNGGDTYGNRFLLPLLGGSGGGGSAGDFGGGDIVSGFGGAAGGGGLLIASSTSIGINGNINADGGDGLGNWPTDPKFTNGGAGSGGAIRLVAPSVSGTGTLTAKGGSRPDQPTCASDGRIRIEAVNLNFIGSTIGASSIVSLVPSTVLLTDVQLAILRIVSVAGMPVPANPGGSTINADVVFTAATNVDIVIESSEIVPGTVIEVGIQNQTEGTQSITSPPLAGSLASSSTTVNATIPPGISRITTKATWTVP